MSSLTYKYLLWLIVGVAFLVAPFVAYPLFIIKMLCAALLAASAPNPYTVSVGKATKSPLINAAAASLIAVAVQLEMMLIEVIVALYK